MDVLFILCFLPLSGGGGAVPLGGTNVGKEITDTEHPKEFKVDEARIPLVPVGSMDEATPEQFTTPQDDPKPENEPSGQNKTQTQTAEIEEDLADGEYDLIQVEKPSGITVRISKHEIYSAKDISVEAIEDVPPELELKETEAIISVGLKMSPSNAIFDTPVRVTMPHCGVFTKPRDAEVYIYYRENDSTKFTAIRSTSTSNPRCVVRDRDLDIYLNHFSEFWIRICDKLKGVFIGKLVVCTPCVPVSAPRNEEHVLLVNVRDHNVTDWKVPDGYKAPLPGEQFFVRWHSGGLKISCKANNIINKSETIEESDFRYLTQRQKTFVIDTRNVTENTKIILDFTFQQNTTMRLDTVMRLGDVRQTTAKTSRASTSTGAVDITISEKELLMLSLEIAPTYYKRVGVYLNIPIVTLENIKEHSRDNCDALMTVFTRWRDKQLPDTNIRAHLADALQKSGLVSLSQKLIPIDQLGTETASAISEGGAHSTSTIPIASQSVGNHPAEYPSCSSSSETREKRRRDENDFDDILREIARKLVKSSDIDYLGGKLGFKPGDIKRYIDANTDADYMGTLDMLRTWRRGTNRSKERELLKKALIDIGYISLAGKLLGNGGQEGSQPPNQKKIKLK
ncbi:uncharacterized protein LOC121409675 [Lytechinus variegatus]|uniref:uncharacterized protein LOC121409675 n=1 Tax=Lytechinus variegatus TaxID=7654 RepID=UPI001BB27D77|nr:uncharacterized protein LOC121409675 [Lytechinus variegatus]